jgi:hypothetical protein
MLDRTRSQALVWPNLFKPFPVQFFGRQEYFLRDLKGGKFSSAKQLHSFSKLS